jgi:hypothetical protein
MNERGRDRSEKPRAARRGEELVDDQSLGPHRAPDFQLGTGFEVGMLLKEDALYFARPFSQVVPPLGLAIDEVGNPDHELARDRSRLFFEGGVLVRTRRTRDDRCGGEQRG